MTPEMKAWLAERGLTALAVARKAGITRRDMYRMLNGAKPMARQLCRTLRTVYGMTDAERARCLHGLDPDQRDNRPAAVLHGAKAAALCADPQDGTARTGDQGCTTCAPYRRKHDAGSAL